MGRSVGQAIPPFTQPTVDGELRHETQYRDEWRQDVPQASQAISSAAPARIWNSLATRVEPPPRLSSSQPALESDNLSEELLFTAVPVSRGSSLSEVAPPPWLQQELPASRNGSSPARGRSGLLRLSTRRNYLRAAPRRQSHRAANTCQLPRGTRIRLIVTELPFGRAPTADSEKPPNRTQDEPASST